MRGRWVLVAFVVVVVGSLAGLAFARSGPAAKAPQKSGWWAYPPLKAGGHGSTARSYPITSLAPGRLILARLRLRDGAPYFIYGQRIRFQQRLYFCLSAGNARGSFQTCPPWPLARGKTNLLIGGGPGRVELALSINRPGQQCTFFDIPGGPYPAFRVPLPPALKIRGELYYAFVKRPAGDGVPRSTKSGTSMQFSIGDSGRARCRPAALANQIIDLVVASQLSVFRRPHTSADGVPATFREELQQIVAGERPDFAQARRVNASDGQVAYLVPTKAGVCVINTNEELCPPAASLAGADTVDLCSPQLPLGRIEIEWLLPDGATGVALGMANGTATRLASGYNVYITRVAINGSLPNTIEWYAGGQHHSVSAGVPGDAQSERCAHPTDLPPAPKTSRQPTASVKTISSAPVRILHQPAADATLRKALRSLTSVFRNRSGDERHSS